MKYHIALPFLAAALACSSLANAEDAEFCGALANIMPLAKSGFSGVRASRVEDVDNLWTVRQKLPYASSCHVQRFVNAVDGESYTYGCQFRLSGKKTPSAVAAEFVENIKACRPDMKSRSGDDGTIYMSSAQGRIAVSAFSARVDIDIRKPEED